MTPTRTSSWPRTRARRRSPIWPMTSQRRTGSGSATRSHRADRTATTTSRWASTARHLGVRAPSLPRARPRRRRRAVHRGRDRRHVRRRLRQRHAPVGPGAVARRLRSSPRVPRPRSGPCPLPRRATSSVRAARIVIGVTTTGPCCPSVGRSTRSSKSITLSEPARRALGVDTTVFTPDEVISAILCRAGRSALERRHRHVREGLEGDASRGR